MADQSRYDSHNSVSGGDDDARLLAARAAEAARAELRGDRARMLGAKGLSSLVRPARQRCVPDRWSLPHVLDRLEEAFRTLGRLPAHKGPRGYVNSMPFYKYDRADLNCQLETDELKRMVERRNEVRIPPSPAQVGRMEEALRWPAAYLSGLEFHHVARAVNLGALWAAAGEDVDRALRRIQVPRRAFIARQQHGLHIITRELMRQRVPVR
jgi:hypothetical protein